MFIGSEALRNHFGDADVMLRQTRFLKDLIELSRTMTIRLAPSQAVTEEAFSRYALKDSSARILAKPRLSAAQSAKARTSWSGRKNA
ncbi:hypothetical protein F9C11_34075 [Amycolatopsis sp. VS8301801F10]|uniref:hypothetical protein n=1 Tax=Amycolatopsis sp. VS8301801F10 TaxID=2652442 RepID=UPI0038FBE982